MGTTTQVWTTRRLIAWLSEAFAGKGLPAPRLSAEILVSHVLGCDRLRLAMDADRPASAEERERLRALAGRALKHEPIQYLVGEWWFFGLPLKVDRRVLIPRPETEVIVEEVLQHARSSPGEVLVADVGTGSGCIAIAIAKHRKDARVIAVDASREALDVARENAARHGVSERVEFVEGDLLRPLVERGLAGRMHYLCSNPPYVPDEEWAAVASNVRDYEPEMALRGGADGLRFVRPVLEGAAELLRPGGMVLVEVAESRAGEARGIAERAGLVDVRVLKDHEGRERVVRGIKGD